MNARERYYATTHFEPVDRVFFLPPWCWDATLVRWRAEGLPADVTLAEYFGTDPYRVAPINGGPLGTVGVSQLRGYALDGHFASGSMGPKVDAACRFVEHGGTRSVITNLTNISDAVAGRAGTVVVPD